MLITLYDFMRCRCQARHEHIFWLLLRWFVIWGCWSLHKASIRLADNDSIKLFLWLFSKRRQSSWMWPLFFIHIKRINHLLKTMPQVNLTAW